MININSYLESYSLSLLKKDESESGNYISLKYDNPIFKKTNKIMEGLKEQENIISVMSKYKDKGFLDFKEIKKNNIFLKWKILDNNRFYKIFNLMSNNDKINYIKSIISLNQYTENILINYIGTSNKKIDIDVYIFKIINYLTNDNFVGGDLRTLSVKIFLDDKKDMSKVLEKYINTALSIIALYENIDDIEILKDRYGLTKYPVSIAVKGDFKIIFNNNDNYIINGNIPPYIMIHPEQIKNFINIGCKRVLTIENKTCFERYVREINDLETLVIFTHGNPSTSILNFLKKISESINEFYHWGDIDIMGIQIILTMSDYINKNILPIGFNKKDIIDFGKNAINDYSKEITKFNNLLSIIKDKKGFELYSQAMIDMVRVEQENIDPSFVYKEILKLI